MLLKIIPYLQAIWLIMAIPTWHPCAPIPPPVLLARPASQENESSLENPMMKSALSCPTTSTRWKQLENRNHILYTYTHPITPPRCLLHIQHSQKYSPWNMPPQKDTLLLFSTSFLQATTLYVSRTFSSFLSRYYLSMTNSLSTSKE